MSSAINLVVPLSIGLALNVFAPLNVCVSVRWAVFDDKYASAMAVPCQVPVPIVPTVVIFEVPANVEIAVFSTLVKFEP